MSSSQFDDLLGDFGDTSSSTTTKTTPNGDSNSELLLDFGGGSQTNGQVSSNGVNPLYDLDSEDTASSPQEPTTVAQPASSNPLYDFDFSADTPASEAPAPQSSNPLYEFENTAEPESEPAAAPSSNNPFQDFESLDGAGGEAPQDSSVDFLSGGTTTTTEDAPSGEQPAGTADLLGDFNTSEETSSPQQAVDESNTMLEGDSGIQSEHNGSSNLLDDFASSGVTITTTQDQEQQPEETVGAPEEDPPQAVAEEQAGSEEIAKEDYADDDIVAGEALPDLVVTEEGDDEKVEAVDHGVPHGEEEAQSGDATQEEEAVCEDEAPLEEAHADETQPEVEEGGEPRGDDYSADKREEDLEQYCIDREEETSEVSEGVSGAVESEPCDVVEEQQPVEEDVKNDEGEALVEESRAAVEGVEVEDVTDGHNEEDMGVEDGPKEDEDQQDDEDERDQVSTQEEEEGEEAGQEPEVVVDDNVAPEPSEEEPEVPRDVDRAEDSTEQQQQQQQAEEEEVGDVVDDTPAVTQSEEAEEEKEEEPLEVTTTTTVEDSPNHIQDSEPEETSNQIQETTEDQWPPKDNTEQPQQAEDIPAIHIHEAQTPASTPEEFPEEVEEDTQQQPEVMSSRGPTAVQSNPPQPAKQWEGEEEEDDDEEEEGVYENEPVKRDDVARESDRTEDVSLPSPGLAQNILAKFNTGTASNSTPRTKREITPPNPTMGGGEYVSEPRVVLERYEGKTESGVFESEPQHNPEVVRSDSHLDESLPEQGSAKKFAARYAQIDQEGKTTVMTKKKQMTPDRDTGPVEYVSEPRGFVETYQGKADSGVFESQPENMPDVVKSGEKQAQDPVPERGTAKNLAQRFHQISMDSAVPVASSNGRNKRELTPDQSGRTEYVSEPRTQTESYETKVESGVFENTPMEDNEVVKSQTTKEEFVPERGYAKNVAAKFKELENTAKSPPLSPGRRKEFTPPREDQATSRTSGVYESTPETKPDVVMSSESQQEVMPGAGTAKSLAQRYKEIEAQNKTPVTSRPKKDNTPPPNSTGVFENKPERFQADYNRPAESGILENTPTAQRDDVLKSGEGNNTGVDLPEAGSARNLVSKWRQIESESAKNTSPGSAGRNKEFTPPREEPRIMQNRNRKFKSPRTPKSPMADGSGHQLDNGSVHPSELPGQYQPQNEPHVFESTPEARPEALREADTDKSVGLPKKNQAKKMLARFQSIQEKADKEAPKPIPKKQEPNKPKTFRKVGRSKSMRAAVQVEKCGSCDKTVYAMERLEMNKRVYHRACFRCSQCKAVLTPKTFAINNEVIFCTTHYKQNFTTKGNYDEGFGRQQHKKHWNSNPNLASSDNANTTNDSTADGDHS